MKNGTVRNILVRIGAPSTVAVGLWLIVQNWFLLISPFSVLLNIEGTLLLAFAISFPPGPNRLRWFFFESMNYGSTPSFSYLNFYLGLCSLTVGIVIGAIK